MKTIFIAFIAGALSIISANADTVTVATNPIGAYTISCPANADTYVSVPVTRTAEFTGAVESVQSGSAKIVANGEPNWATNKFVYVSGAQSNHYYLKFTSGKLNGAWYDITSNDAYSVTIDIGEAELGEIAVSDTFQIIPHWTLSTLFPEGGGLKASTGIVANTNCSSVYKYTSYEGGVLVLPVGENRAFKNSFYYRNRSTDIGWRNSSGRAVSDDEVIEPNTFIVIRQPDTEATVSVSGSVPMCASSIELSRLSATENQDNYVAIPTCTDIKLSDLNSALIDSGMFTPSTNSIVAVPVDKLLVYDNTKHIQNPSPTASYFYRKTATKNGWFDTNLNVADDVVLKAGTAIIIKKKANGSLTADRSAFTPQYAK